MRSNILSKNRFIDAILDNMEREYKSIKSNPTT